MARPTRYYVFDTFLKLNVGGLYSKSYEDAEAQAKKDFGQHCYVRSLAAVRGTWKEGSSDLFWTRDSQYGVKYKCKVCGKENLGRGAYNHWPECPAKT